MAEICAPGLWDVTGCARLPDELPISPTLIERIAAWQTWYDDLDDQNTSFPNPTYWEQRTDMPIAAFNARGRAIAAALKAELPPDWTVIAVDVDAWCRKNGDSDDELILLGVTM